MIWSFRASKFCLLPSYFLQILSTTSNTVGSRNHPRGDAGVRTCDEGLLSMGAAMARLIPPMAPVIARPGRPG